MNEITGIFGPERHLVGTLALSATRPGQAVGFILLNAGMIHRIGPHRLNVKLGRALAANGFASIRFDLSGQGDSRAPADAAPVIEQAVADLRAAMDHMERTVGMRQFAIAGVCSGAHHAVATGLVDTRVVGIWMYDSFIYSTLKTRQNFYLRRMRELGLFGVARWLSRRVRTAVKFRSARALEPETNVGVQEWQAKPSREEYGQALQQLVDRGVRVSTTYSGSFLEEFNYAQQFRDAFQDFAMVDVVECAFRPEMDHTITAVDAQREVIAAVCAWAARFRPAADAPQGQSASF